MKRVAIVYSGARYQGGVEAYLKNLFKYYDKKKVELVFVSLGEWPLCDRIRRTGSQVFILPGRRIRPRTFFDIKKLVESEDISLAVSQGVVANFYARVGARLAHVPHLTTVHSDIKAEYSNALIKCLYSFSDFLTRPLTKKYIVASNYLKKALTSRGVEKDKIQVIYHGVVLDRRTHAPLQGAGQAEKQKEIVIGSLGRLDKVKGYDKLIRAFSMLGSTDAKLVIWGEGKERKSLEELTKKLGLEDRVEMPGYIEDTKKALSRLDIYIQPSLSEGLGLSVIEAMLAKKPVIVTPAGALTEIVEDGKTGFAAEGTNPEAIAGAIKRVLDGFENMQEIIERAETKARERFSIERCAAETIDTYLDTLN